MQNGGDARDIRRIAITQCEPKRGASGALNDYALGSLTGQTPTLIDGFKPLGFPGLADGVGGREGRQIAGPAKRHGDRVLNHTAARIFVTSLSNIG